METTTLLKHHTAVRVLPTDHRSYLHGMVGYIYLNEGESDGMMSPSEGCVLVAFDSEATNQCACGVKPQDLEAVGDLEDYAIWSLSRHLTNRTPRMSGNVILQVAKTIWGAAHSGVEWAEPELRTLHAFLCEKYAYRFEEPWDQLTEACKDIVNQIEADKLTDPIEIRSELRKACSLTDEIANHIWACAYSPGTDLTWTARRFSKMARAYRENIYQRKPHKPA